MELPGKRELREQILHQMDGRTSYVSDKDVYREIDKAILRSSHGGYGTLSEKEELRRQMFYSIRGFDVLEKYLGDSSISEIMVIGASRIFVEQNGKIRRIEEHFSEEGDVYRLIEQIVAPTNRMVNEACPIVDSRLPDGSRVHIVLPPVSLEGPVITIRKFLKGGMTIEKLLAFEEFPEKLTGILSALVKSRYNILISGATNSGKSSLLNALAEYIGKRERVITIELRPEYIYEDSKGEIQWIYFPQTSLGSEIKSNLQDRELQNKNEDLQKRMEALFAWMLPQIDYEDTDAVQFMYRFYNKVRKLGFSKELLETYIQTKRQKEYYDIEEVDKTSAKVRDSSKIKQDRRSNNESISYEEFFKEELELEKQKIESPNNRKQKTGDFQIGIKNGRRNSRREVQRNERNRDEKNKNQSNENNYLILYNGLKIISVICTFLAVILEGIFVFYGMRSGFTRQLFQYSVGGMLLIIVFACGFIWSAQTVRKIKQKNKSNSMNSIKDNINKQNKVRHRKRGEQGSSISDKFIQEKELQNRTQMIKTEVDWEAEGDWESGTEGTTILNYGNESEKEDGKICHPMLRDMELGIIYVIKNCPFYIGSAEGVNHLHIQDKTVSREHAVILEDIYEGDGQGYILRDMGSTNGTWLNGKKIKRGNQEQLEDGAVIRFAKKEYEFLIQDI